MVEQVAAGVRLDGKVAFVTGAGSGIGRSIARTVAGAGALAVCADIDEAAANETAELIGAANARAQAVQLDVTDRAQVFAEVVEVAGAAGGLHIMCNVAGVAGNGSAFVDLEESELDRVLGVHLKGVIFGCQAAATVMAGQGGGSIVNMSSTAIDTPRAKMTAYTAAKAGIAALTKVLAVELGPDGIRVNAVAPGFVITPLALKAFTRDDGSVDEPARDDMLAAMTAMSPLQRLGEVDDVARLVLFLASDAASFVTGQTMRVNGGASMPW